VIRPEKTMQISYFDGVVIFGSYDRFLGGDHDRGGAEDLDHDASVAWGNYVVDRKAIWGCGTAVRRNQTKEE
jgi:hypothetical protein